MAYNVLIELHGAEANANDLTRENFREVLAFLQKIPKQIGNNKKKWAGKSLRQIVEITHKEDNYEDQLFSIENVNKYMRRIGQVMKWAEREPLIGRNYADEIYITPDETDNDDKRRLPFSTEQLDTIFKSEYFISPIISEPSTYWPILFGLFHGMRSEEILQLRLSDFKTEEDILYIDIHKRNGNHLKNRASIRKILVHPFLLDLGLKSFISQKNRDEQAHLFYDLTRGVDNKFTPSFSKRFSRFLTKINTKTTKTSFHSTRHNFRDVARNADISEARVCALGGWTFSSGVHEGYGEGYWMSEKFKSL